MQPNNSQRPSPPRPRAQFFDVVRPGRTPASPNARPVLASNHPPVQDTSMMKGAPAVPPGLMKAAPAPTPLQQTVPKPMPKQPLPQPQPRISTPVTRPAPIMPAQQDVGKAAVDSEVASESIFQPKETFEPQADHQTKPKHSVWSELFAVLAIVLLIAIIVNILLDADVINLPLPHTNFFEY